MAGKFKRRNFLLGLTAAGCATKPPAPAENGTGADKQGERAQDKPEPESGEILDAGHRPKNEAMARRPLGKTGETVSALGLGGYHLGIPSEREATAIMHRAIDQGMNFFDNCWDYHGGESERRMGRALQGGKREKVFLMTKIDARTKQAAHLQIDECLRRLQTDRIDLMQIHEVAREKDGPWVFGEDGAISALQEAQQAGKIRFTGFTGHKSPLIHLSMLDAARLHGFAFDAVQMPLNALDPHFKSFEKLVLPRLVAEGIAVLGMKSLASGLALKSGLQPQQCLRYSLSLPTSVVITGCDSLPILDQALQVARSFVPMQDDEKLALLERTQPFGKQGELEMFKTTDRYDATLRNKHWLTTGNL